MDPEDMHISLHPDLWVRIRAFPLDDGKASFAFSHRLARENDWGYAYTLRTMMEYKKFLYLICITEGPLTPSQAVDQVWHLHLIYTQSYWQDLCRDTLGRDIHHGPTKGGGTEKTKYQDLYSRTFSAYREAFGEEPPADIWPSAKRRFGEIRFTWVNRHRFWLLPKPRFFRS